MSEELEQTSEIIAEENTFATSNQIFTSLPLHVQQSLLLTTMKEEDKPNVRCLFLNDGKVFFTVILEELGDSFLVGAATRLNLRADNILTADVVSSEPVMRVYKSCIAYMTMPTAKYLYTYYVFLRNLGDTILPGYLTDAMKASINKLIKEHENTYPIEYVEERVTKLETLGASRDSFTPHTRSELIH